MEYWAKWGDTKGGEMQGDSEPIADVKLRDSLADQTQDKSS